MAYAFLLRDGLNQLDIEIEENHSVTDICQVWLQFFAANNTPVRESKRVMISILSVVYSALLEHVSNHHCTSSIETESSFETVIDDDDIYYRFGGAALCEIFEKDVKSLKTVENNKETPFPKKFAFCRQLIQKIKQVFQDTLNFVTEDICISHTKFFYHFSAMLISL